MGKSDRQKRSHNAEQQGIQLSSGYDGGFSIEPHMVSVLHGEAGEEDAGYQNYIEYGKRFMRLVEETKK